MIDNIDKKYEPKNVEEKVYKMWNEKGFFHAEVNNEKESFTMVIPPPNITGQLHMGHALDNTLQDILARYKRMRGFEVLWLPGTDHASIATEAKIVEAMAKEKLTKEEIGREAFLKRAWEWKEFYGGRIIDQLKKLGSSCDWERERFTMDEGLSEAVKKVFINLYEKDLIYRGERIINWCPKCLTSISDAEVEYEEKNGNLWSVKYHIKDSNEFITVATTRPETMLGDTAIAVNPTDDKYKNLIGKYAILPIVGREIPIIADDYVEKDFGTGAVKITPAHDPNDFEVGLRHNLEQIKVMNDNATMNEFAGKYKGFDRYIARKEIIKDLEKLNLLTEIKVHKHNVGTCYRCSTVIEPIISKQWFVKMKPLAKPAIDIVKNGELKFLPERFSKIYFSWMENIQDWCISRQLWWGHRIPAYYCMDCKKIIVKNNFPDKCDDCGSKNIKQDEDTLDTWFSSALWPFSTLGWPEKTKDLEYFYPTDVLVTGYDIIFFWVARMIFSGIEHMNEKPFKHVFVHGLVRDEQGRKMSKSLGNGIDPLDVIEKYGTDSLRFSLTKGIATGNDLRYSDKKVESSRNFANKLWNASRFVLMNFDENISIDNINIDRLNLADKWILRRLNIIIQEVTDNMEKFELGIALEKLYEFTWDEFCDWYIELVKTRLYDKDNDLRAEALYVLNYTLKNIMKLIHPFMPFITEEIYSHLIHDDKSIMISSWPEINSSFNFEKEEKDMLKIMEVIKAVRNIRAEMNVPFSKRAKVFIITKNKKDNDIFIEGKIFIEKLGYAMEVNVLNEKNSININNMASAIISDSEIFIPLEDLIDIDKEIERIMKEKKNLEKELKRVDGKLSNENFIKKAPQKVINEEKEKQKKYKNMYNKLLERVRSLNI
ncbi:MAG: valine--tRNA ligase [Clostridiales bacterium]